MKKYNHIIWDWNGTLINDVDVCVSSMNCVLEKYNKQLINKEIYRSIFDFPVKYYYEKAGFDFNEVDFSIVGMEFIHTYNSEIKNQKLHEGVQQLLELFQKHNIIQIVLSAREQKQLEDELKHFEIDSYISKIIGLDNNFAFGKVENGLNYLKQTNTKKQNIVLIGDTLHDADVAKAMQIDCILISHGHQNTEKLRKANCLIISSFNELFPYFF
jgi:phosphoglycolate phosphatase